MTQTQKTLGHSLRKHFDTDQENAWTQTQKTLGHRLRKLLDTVSENSWTQSQKRRAVPTLVEHLLLRILSEIGRCILKGRISQFKEIQCQQIYLWFLDLHSSSHFARLLFNYQLQNKQRIKQLLVKCYLCRKSRSSSFCQRQLKHQAPHHHLP